MKTKIERKKKPEPAKSFTFTVNRVPHSPNQFNLTCQANQVFPRPSLALIRYRAGPPSAKAAALTAAGEHQLGRHKGRPQQSARQQQQQPLGGRPKLAATSLRQEPIADTKTHLTLSYARAGLGLLPSSKVELDSDTNDINHFALPPSSSEEESTELRPSFYDISSWALIDEASLSSYVVTQFECLLSIDGLDQIRDQQQQQQQQQRLSLALQKGKSSSWSFSPVYFAPQIMLAFLPSGFERQQSGHKNSFFSARLSWPLLMSLLIARSIRQHRRLFVCVNQLRTFPN